MSSYYGVIFPEFWTGTTGRLIRELGGKDGQLLGLYLASNRHANMIGLYRLLPDDVKHETGLGAKAIERGYAATGASEFAVFDAATSYVWVRQMARFRLNLKPGDALDTEDKRVPAVNRIYHALDANPFLGEFYDANHRMLRLRKRREPVGLVVSLKEHHQMLPIQGARKGLVSQVTESGNRDQDQDQERAAATPPSPSAHENPRENLRVITRLVHDVLRSPDAPSDFASLKADVKNACARHKILYDAEVAGAALESALAQRKQAAR